MPNSPRLPLPRGSADAASSAAQARASLPSVDRVLRSSQGRALSRIHGHELVAGCARRILATLRERACEGKLASEATSDEALAQALRAECDARLAPRLRGVVNLTGTVIHSNLDLSPERLAERLLVLRLLTRPQASIRTMAEALAEPVAAALAPRFEVGVVELASQIGSGSLPVERLASAGLEVTAAGGLRPARADSALHELAHVLRTLPVLGRIAGRRLLLDLRCLESTDPLLAQLPALARALRP